MCEPSKLERNGDATRRDAAFRSFLLTRLGFSQLVKPCVRSSARSQLQRHMARPRQSPGLLSTDVQGVSTKSSLKSEAIARASLPVEIVDIIFGFLMKNLSKPMDIIEAHRDDRGRDRVETLARIALVNKALYKFARPLLEDLIVLSSDDDIEAFFRGGLKAYSKAKRVALLGSKQHAHDLETGKGMLNVLLCGVLVASLKGSLKELALGRVHRFPEEVFQADQLRGQPFLRLAGRVLSADV